ncbi:hypothetical protein N7520_000289 [Penicillium odoratum]|uniref:uncharacterized protein n=1 Tax=Penicillium odoratum TaxID=1167516 RepID=UPI002547FEE0|nr:uncharacterized protein N7520_000289 [Penicillium odoratum]KAJ5777043.1 hypothetical protein N7520_000289 [Penicillium odoratum]
MPFLDKWPQWPDFVESDVPAEAEERIRGYKKQILAEYGEKNLRKAWVKTCERLEEVTREILAQGSSIIPVLDFEELKSLGEQKKQRMKELGCFVIREVIPKDEITSLFKDLKDYIAVNKESISAWPEANPAVYRLSWTPTQQAIRGHPRHLQVQKYLNGCWHDEMHATSPEPLTYADSLRIRPPGQEFYGLGPHIDAGSLCRWADPSYRKVYQKIFSGYPEDHDCYDLGIRKDANQAAFKGSAHSTVFRAFQGWTAMTGAKPREGSLLLYPYVGVAMSYLLLRPFFTPPTEGDIMDASRWTFSADNGWFPGTDQKTSQYLGRESHPHLRLEECLVYIPDMEPGDTIWWHCDMIHAVEIEHSGLHDASVVYIAATPTTETNIQYIKSQLEDFLKGNPPEDFPDGTDESKLVGYLGEKGLLSDEARKAMGYGL